MNSQQAPVVSSDNADDPELNSKNEQEFHKSEKLKFRERSPKGGEETSATSDPDSYNNSRQDKGEENTPDIEP